MITAYLVRNPQIVWLAIVVILIAGISCLFVMPRLEDPVLKQRVGVISTTLAGSGAAEVESSVTVAVEDWLQEFSEIKQIRSNTRANVANVVVELADEVNQPDVVWSAIERKLQSSASQLPAGSGEPELTVFPLKAFAAIIAVRPVSESGSLVQATRLATELESQLLGIAGTQQTELFGSVVEQLVISVEPATLAATGLSPPTIATQIAGSRSVPGGNLRSDGLRLPVELPVAADLQQRIESLFIELPSGQDSFRLSELASVSRQAVTPRTEQAIVGGRDAAVLAVMVDQRYRIDLWSDDCRAVVTGFNEKYSSDYRIEEIFMQADELQQRMQNLLRNLLISAAAVVGIVFLFMGWRCMLVVAVALPLSSCIVLCGLRLLDIPIHQMSVTGLIVALGLLIDNAIVMVEEVRSRVYSGLSALESIRRSVGHLSVPLLGSTMTTMLAFLPIATMPGPSGEFVGSLAVSVILAVGASLFLAVTILPPLVFLMGVSPHRRGFLDCGCQVGFIENLYRGSLKTVFRFPLIGVLIGIALPVAGFYFAGSLPRQFFPATDRAQIQIELELAAASDVDAVRDTVDRVYSIVAEHPNVDQQNWFIGKSAPTFYYNIIPRRRDSPSYAQCMVDLKGGFDADRLVDDLQTTIDSKIFDARTTVRKLEQGPPFDAPLEIRLQGNDLSLLKQYGDQVRQILAAQPNVTHTRCDLTDTAPKLKLDVSDHAVQQVGLSQQDVSRMLHAQLEGSDAGTFFDRGLQIPVRVVVDFSDRSITDTLLATTMSVSSSSAASDVPAAGQRPAQRAPETFSLGSVGDFELSADAGAIIRLNGQRMNEVKAYLKAGVLPSKALQKFKADLQAAEFRVPEQIEIQFGGEDEKRQQAISTLVANAMFIISILILTLVAVTGSFRTAAIVAAVGSLAMGLGPLALYCFGFPLGFMAIVGTMGLIGIAINDSIVVLAAIGDRGSRSDDSSEVTDRTAELTDTVCSCTRHILATTVTTMIGFLPLVLDGGRFWPPLAIVISAGVGGATLLALYFVPSLYLLLHRDGSVKL